MQTPIPGSRDPLFALTKDALSGLHTYGIALDVKQNEEAVVAAEFKDAQYAATAQDSSIAARAAAVAAQQQADRAVWDFIMTAREVLAPTLGRHYTAAWREVGYHTHSLAVPQTLDGREQLIAAMGQYLTAHPAMENPARQMTQAEALARSTALAAARRAVKDAWTAQRTKTAAWTRAAHDLQKRLRGLYHELEQLLAPDDPRWANFGFNLPADHSLPEQPADVAVEDGAAKHVCVSWARAARAFEYRVFQMVVGVDADYALAKQTEGLEATLNSYQSGARVRIQVSATNSAGESLRSEPVEHVVP